MEIIRTERLTKFYGPTRGVEDLNLEIQTGEIFGFLGPNGAGKTTTVRLLLGLIRPTRGQATIFGLDTWQDAVAIKERLGVLSEALSLYEGMSGAEFLLFMDQLQPQQTPTLRDELADRLKLSQRDLGRRIRDYSRGMRQKLGIIQAFQHDPELLILDEPTEGLDPLMKHVFYELLDECRDHGRTIFLSSHILSEVERVCDRVAMIRDGRLVAIDRVETLQRRKVRRMEVTFAPGVEIDKIQLPGATIERIENHHVWLLVRGNAGPLIRELARYDVEDLVFERARLEEVFLEYYRGGEAQET